MGWLQRLTDWLAQLVRDVWNAVVSFFEDLLVTTIEGILNIFALAIEAIPVPDWVTQNSIGALLSNLPDSALWFITVMKVPEGFAILGLGWVFRLTRKLLTLGQW